jgi:hypothetical protein
MTLLMVVERHLRAGAVSPSRFGRQVSGDPRFVFDLRRGREPRPATAARVLAYIADAETRDAANRLACGGSKRA